MKKFRCTREVVTVEGSQEYEVEANSIEEAIKKFLAGDSEIIESELEVLHSEDFDFDNIEEVEITIEEAYEMGKPCKECSEHPDDGGNCIYPYYGVAPHTHGKNWESKIVPKSEWPKNFSEDPEQPGCGTYTHCLTCGAPNV